jgi:hypothetical protein
MYIRGSHEASSRDHYDQRGEHPQGQQRGTDMQRDERQRDHDMDHQHAHEINSDNLPETIKNSIQREYGDVDIDEVFMEFSQEGEIIYRVVFEGDDDDAEYTRRYHYDGSEYGQSRMRDDMQQPDRRWQDQQDDPYQDDARDGQWRDDQQRDLDQGEDRLDRRRQDDDGMRDDPYYQDQEDMHEDDILRRDDQRWRDDDLDNDPQRPGGPNMQQQPGQRGQQQQQLQDEQFRDTEEIDVDELPQVIQNRVQREFREADIESASRAYTLDGQMVYKVKIDHPDRGEITKHYHADGREYMHMQREREQQWISRIQEEIRTG